MFWRTKPKPNPVETQTFRLLGGHAPPLIEEMFANTKPKARSETDISKPDLDMATIEADILAALSNKHIERWLVSNLSSEYHSPPPFCLTYPY
jgi:hypothetical protein